MLDFQASRKHFLGQIHDVSVLEVLPRPQLGRLFGCKTINQISVVLEWFYDEQLSVSENLANAERKGVKFGSIVRCEIVAVTRVALVGRFIGNLLDDSLTNPLGTTRGLVCLVDSVARPAE